MAPADIALGDQVSAALEQSPYLNNRNLRIETHQGRVTLKGSVPTYYQKQMAQEALKRLSGIAHIENHLEVNWA